MTGYCDIAVTDREYRKAESVFLDAVEAGFRCVPVPAEEHACAQAIRELGARYAILGADRYFGPLYDALPAGGVIARFGVGYDGLDLGQASAHRILCTNTPGVLDDSVAELAMALIACAARPLVRCISSTRVGGWEIGVGAELRGKTLAVLGCGGIGRRLARMASFGYGMRVVGFRTRLDGASVLKCDFGFADIVTDFGMAVGSADFVSVHLPSNAETRHFLHAERLAALQSSAWLINTARGAVVDETALFDALVGTRLAGAALDVFEIEPYTPVDPLRDLRSLPNVLMTPHIGSATTEACNRMACRALENVRLSQCGSYAAMDLLNPEVVAG